MGKRRVFLIVLDSYGIGAEPDADLFGDIGSNTLKTIAGNAAYDTPVMKSMGLFNIDGVVEWAEGVDSPKGAFARLQESSMGKDTTI